MPVTISCWDLSQYLESPEDMLAYLDEAAHSGEPALPQAALGGDIAKAKGRTKSPARIAAIR